MGLRAGRKKPTKLNRRKRALNRVDNKQTFDINNDATCHVLYTSLVEKYQQLYTYYEGTFTFIR